MAKYLIHLAFPSWVIDNMVMYDAAIKLQQQGNEVHVLYCVGTPSVCFTNPCQDKIICRWCNWHRNRMNQSLPDEIKIHTFNEYYDESLIKIVKQFSLNYSSVEDIKNLEYKNVKIGYGALSTYISQTRNLNPLVDDEFKNFFNSYLVAECLLTEILDKSLADIKPDYVSLYNGRFFETRPIYDYSKKLGYKVRCYENIYPLGLENGMSTVFFENYLPHNIKLNTELIENNWNNSLLPRDEKEKIGRSFFENRKTGKRVGDIVYTSAQKNGLLPENWNKAKRNIVIFNSSEDEFAAIGDEYEGLSLFANQIEGVKKILDLFKNEKNLYFYLRVHPNLTGIKYRYHLDLYELEKQFDNIKVIPSDSEVSSYSLLDAAEKIIVFGSTIGVEAAYWGKPVILLSETFYSYLNICYRPQSIDEMRIMILADLKNKEALPAIKYGFFIMKDARGDLITNFDTRATIIKKKYFFFKFKPIKYSTVYLAVIKMLLVGLNRIYPRSKKSIPNKENN
ncbi:MAG: capsule biosynthesis protein [Patescibacteria group bacterium]